MTKPKVILIGTDARNKLIEGVDFLAKAVKSTMGPFGQNFLLEKKNRVTNDGVTVARAMEHPEEIPNRGLIAAREAAVKTVDEVGDGTSTAIALTHAILKEAIRYLGDEKKQLIAKKTPIEVVRQIEEERVLVTEKLVAMAKPIKTREALIKSALVSVEDEELAELIGGAQFDLGPEGILIAEETAEKTSSVERVHGLRIDNGFGTSVLINNEEKQQLEVDDTRVILTNYTLQDLKPLQNIIDQLVKTGTRTITIVARAFTSECIQVCLKNINGGAVKIYPINAPYTDQNEVMKDLAAVLGGKYIFDEEMSLDDVQLSDVGFAERLVARRYDAVITGKNSPVTQVRVDTRIDELTKKISGEVSEFEKKNIESRIAQLKNGFALIKVGATSETERGYKKDKADDAVNAVKAAYQEGVVPGAGLAFKKIAEELPDTAILKRPLMSIYEHITYTAPKDFEIPDWVKDPVKVLRVALEKACSVASVLATAAGAETTAFDKPRYIEVANTQGNE